MLLRILIVLSVISFYSNVFAATDIHYMVHGGAGAKTGADLANAFGETEFNASGNWDTDEDDDNKIGIGDTVYFYDDNGEFETATADNYVLVILGSGSVGKPITFTAVPGENPEIKGTEDVSDSWSGSGPYTRTLTVDPKVVFFDDVQIDKDTTSSPAAGKWFWDTAGGGTLYLGSDPSGHVVESGKHLYGLYAVKRDYLTIKNISIYGCKTIGFYITGDATAQSDHIIFTNNHVWGVGADTDSTTAGVSFQVVDSEFSHNLVHDCGGKCLAVVGGTFSADRNTVESNIMYDCWHNVMDVRINNGADISPLDGTIIRYNNIYLQNATKMALYATVNGIYLNSADATNDDHVTNTDIYYNIIHGVTGYGIYIDDRCSGTEIYNNTIVAHSKDINLDVDDGTVIVKNNILAGDGAQNLKHEAAVPANATFDANLYCGAACGATDIIELDAAHPTLVTWNGYAYVTDDLEGNPLFNQSNYFLPKYTSPAIDAGTDVSLTTDYTGGKVPRGAGVDIGAYEYEPRAIDWMKKMFSGMGLNM